MHGGKDLYVHLCLVLDVSFTALLCAPDFYVALGLIVTLLKNKHGDASLLNTCRGGITISSAMSKWVFTVLESTLQHGCRQLVITHLSQ